MSGILILQGRGGWKRGVAVFAVSALFTALSVLPMARHLPLTGMSRAAVVALTAYALVRVSYRAFDTGLRRREAPAELTWRLTEDTLTIGDDAIPRRSIRMVHCWPNRDALGHTLPGWTVNIETDGKNRVLRTLTEGEAESVERLRQLVEALGYGRCWHE